MPQPTAVIVGGSLAGLTSALALARIGVRVDVLERSPENPRTGSALQTSFRELSRAIGKEHARSVMAALGDDAGATPTMWSPLREALRQAADDDLLVTVHHHTRITSVRDTGNRAVALSDDGKEWIADAIIGADGHRSVVRRAIAPEHPDATYAGYSLWIGAVLQSQIPGAPPARSQFFMQYGGPHLLLSYPSPLPDGDMLIGWAMYDATRDALFRQEGAVDGQVVQHTMRARDVPQVTLDELAREASRYWPSPFSDAIAAGARNRDITGIPITEYVPERLATGRLAIVGNAGHVPTPMTGNGFGASVDDAVVLADALEGCTHETIPAALRRYEQRRLHPARALVESGQGFSRSFATET